MFGDNAPGATWEMTFLHAYLGPNTNFSYPPSSFFALGSGFGAPTTVGGKKKTGGKGGGGKGGNPTPTPPARPGH
jgi:hypothetical protein